MIASIALSSFNIASLYFEFEIDSILFLNAAEYWVSIWFNFSCIGSRVSTTVFSQNLSCVVSTVNVVSEKVSTLVSVAVLQEGKTIMKDIKTELLEKDFKIEFIDTKVKKVNYYLIVIAFITAILNLTYFFFTSI